MDTGTCSELKSANDLEENNKLQPKKKLQNDLFGELSMPDLSSWWAKSWML